MAARSGIGIALSGGGNRAALFAVGALLGIKEAHVDSGLAEEYSSIASVSGGSLANGLLAICETPFDVMTPGELELALAPGVEAFSRNGIFFPGRGTNGYVAWFFFWAGLWSSVVVSFGAMLVAVQRDWDPGLAAWIAGGVACAVLVIVLVVVKVKGHVPIRFAGSALLGIATVVGGIPLAITQAPTGKFAWAEYTSRLAAGAAILAALSILVVAVFGYRSKRVDSALNKYLYGDKKLKDCQKSPLHLFCPTNLVTGRQAYFTPNFVYGFGLGDGLPADHLLLSTAVQASACFPGGFRPRRLAPAQVFADTTDKSAGAFTDGGVYDNMGDQWEFGWENRASFVGPLGKPAQQLVVVNAGGFYKPGPLKGFGLGLEARSLLRSKDVMYDQTTAVKRRYLVEAFQKAGTTGLRGVLVHIDQTPFTVPTKLANSPGFQQRSATALKFLTALGNDAKEPDEAKWQKIRGTNKSVPTVLKALEPERAGELMHHAYLLARINLYVVLGIGTIPELEGEVITDAVVLAKWGRARFVNYAKSGPLLAEA